MYCGACGLGEVLPSSGPLYSSQDAAAAAQVALITKDWSLFQSGVEVGGNFDQFQEAVKFGWVPNTPEGYDRFLGVGIGGAADAATLNALPEYLAWWTAWTWAYALSNHTANWTVDQAPELWRSQVLGWIRLGMTPAAEAIADAAFQKYFPLYLARFGTLQAPTFEAATAVVTNPVTGSPIPISSILYAGPLPGMPSVGVIELKTGQRWSFDGGWPGTVIGAPGPLTQQLVDYYANRAAQEAAAARTLVGKKYDAVLIHPTVDSARYFAVTDPTLYSPKYQRVHELYSDNTETVTPWIYAGAGGWLPLSEWQSPGPWGSDGFGPLYPDRVALRLWESLSSSEQQAIQAELAAGPAPAPSVPYVPGSHVYVPAPGTGGEPTIQLPGSSTPIPVSQLPPEIAHETAQQGAQYQQPTTAAPTTPAAAAAPAPAPAPSSPGPAPVPGTAPGSYAVPGGAFPSPVPLEEAAPAPAQAGIPGGLLIGGGILVAAIVLGSSKRRRGKGYRRY